jgi:hypothetical protein
VSESQPTPKKKYRSRDLKTLILDPSNNNLVSPVAIALLKAAKEKP